jgi:hypothetical protein
MITKKLISDFEKFVSSNDINVFDVFDLLIKTKLLTKYNLKELNLHTLNSINSKIFDENQSKLAEYNKLYGGENGIKTKNK